MVRHHSHLGENIVATLSLHLNNALGGLHEFCHIDQYFL